MNTNKERIQKKAVRQEQWLRFLAGCRTVGRSPKKAAILIIYSAVNIWIWFNREMVIELVNMADGGIITIVLEEILKYGIPLVALLIMLVIIMQFSYFRNSQNIRDNLWEMGLYNKASRAPLPLGKYRDKRNRNITIYEFAPLGVLKAKWNLEEIGEMLEVKKPKLEVKGGRYLLHTVPLDSDFDIDIKDDEF